jgi:predicted ArsR family transcriptional regulator
MATEILSPPKTKEEIFDLLKRRGPLCASQIAVEMGLSLRGVTTAMEEMRAEGFVEPRPDRDRSMPYDQYDTPWGLVRPSWLRKKG